MEDDKMYIKEIVCGKALNFKKLDIRARGKRGIIRVPKTSVRITLEEKHPKEFYKLLLQGKAPPSIGQMFKMMLLQSYSSYGRVRSLSHITTSRGRYYRRTQFKRLVQLITKEYQKRGHPINPKKIERNLLNKTADQWW